MERVWKRETQIQEKIRKMSEMTRIGGWRGDERRAERCWVRRQVAGRAAGLGMGRLVCSGNRRYKPLGDELSLSLSGPSLEKRGGQGTPLRA